MVMLAVSPPLVAAHDGESAGIEAADERIPPGGGLGLSGDDWAAAEPLRLILVTAGSTVDLGVILTDAEGHFATVVVIPTDAPPGPAAVDARSERGVIARAIITIDPAAPMPSIPPGSFRQEPPPDDGIDLGPFAALILALAGLAVLVLRTGRVRRSRRLG